LPACQQWKAFLSFSSKKGFPLHKSDINLAVRWKCSGEKIGSLYRRRVVIKEPGEWIRGEKKNVIFGYPICIVEPRRSPPSVIT